MWLLLFALAACGKKGPAVPLESVEVGALRVGMARTAVADKTGCKWEVFTQTRMRGATALVCRDGQMTLDLASYGLTGSVTADVKAYANSPDKVSGFSIVIDIPPLISQDALMAALTKHYTEAIGAPPEMKGKAPNWKLGSKSFFIRPDSENQRITIATFPVT
ncbi:MAG: hypothetical protein ACREJQ_05540 [bacterium]